MPYIGNSDIHAPAYASERNMLLAGLSYEEIADKTGERQRTISERNRLVHKIDIWDAFRSRVEREGIPNRMPADESFRSWFAGFVDGEGSFIIFTRPCTARPQYSEFRLGLRLQIRHDDIAVLDHISQTIECGTRALHKGAGRAQDSVSWRCEKINDLAEVIVPTFDNAPLRSKKGREFAIWRELVMRRYLDTLGGHSQRHGVKEDYRILFHKALNDFAHIRHGAIRIT
jgi:hypothetical protein